MSHARRRLCSLALTLLGVLGSLARAQGPLAAGAPSSPGSPSHAWILVPGTRDDATLRHLPPRTWPQSPSTPDAAFRTAARLAPAPAFAAAATNRLYFVELDPPNFTERAKRVRVLRAISSGVAELWTTAPRQGAESLPSLPLRLTLVAFSACDSGPIALMWEPPTADEPDPTGANSPHRLLLYRDGRWLHAALPQALTDALDELASRSRQPGPGTPPVTLSNAVRLVGHHDSLDIALFVDGAKLRQWHAEIPPPPPPAPPAPEDRPAPALPNAIDLGFQALPDAELPSPSPPADLLLLESGQRQILAHRSPSAGMDLYARVGSRWQHLARLPDVPRHAVVAPLASDGRLVVYWASPAEDSKPDEHLVELSAYTGLEFYAGAPKSLSPITGDDFRLLSISLTVIMAVALIFIIRSERTDTPVHLPTGTALAEPTRRLLATLVDLAVALAIAAAVMGVPLSTAFSLQVIITDGAISLLAATFFVATLLGTAGEATFGKTLGKLVAGYEVIRARPNPANPEDRRPGLLAALARNAFKWGLPPTSLLAFLDANGRHPGDRLARTVAVVHVEPDDAGEP